MMNNITVINDSQLTIKEYKGQRVVTLWDVARLHRTSTTHIRNTFDRNIKKLHINEDYFIVEKQSDFVHTFCMNGEITPQAINASKNIPIFTESGYLMITKSLNDDLSWQVQRQLVNSYFKFKAVKEIIKNQLDANTALETSKFLVELAKEAGVEPESQILITKTIYKEAGIELPIDIVAEEKYYDGLQIAKTIGILSNTGKPHGQVVSAILNMIDINESEKKPVWETNGSWQGTVTKYTYSVIEKVKKWLEENEYPEKVTIKTSNGKDKKFNVLYKKVS